MKHLAVVLILSAFTVAAQSAEIVVPYFLSASDPDRQSFVRIVWKACDSIREMTINAYDDAGNHYSPIAIELPSCDPGALNFNSDDLEFGNSDKHIPWGTGGGEGDWWLRIVSASDITVQAFIRTRDGFLTSAHDILPKEFIDTDRNAYVANTFNPASNRNQVSSLRLVNTSDVEIQGITIYGTVDTGPYKRLRLMHNMSLSPYQVKTITAQELEANADSSWSDRAGKRRLHIFAEDTERLLESLLAMHLMETPTGHITNLSSYMGEGVKRSDYGEAPMSERDFLRTVDGLRICLTSPCTDDYLRIGGVYRSDTDSVEGKVWDRHQRNPWQYTPGEDWNYEQINSITGGLVLDRYRSFSDDECYTAFTFDSRGSGTHLTRCDDQSDSFSGPWYITTD